MVNQRLEVNVPEVRLNQEPESGVFSGVDRDLIEGERQVGGEDVEHSALKKQEGKYFEEDARNDDSESGEVGEDAETEEKVEIESQEGETRQTRQHLELIA